MMSSLDNALAACLSETKAGHNLDDCLARFGTEAEELRELVTLANEVRAVPIPVARPEVKVAQKQRLLDALVNQPTYLPSRPDLLDRLLAGLNPRQALRWSVVMAVILALLLSGVWASSAIAENNLPGDLLYPVKRASEQVEMLLTFNPDVKQQLREEFSRERLKETQEVLILRRRTEVEFTGTLSEIADNYWKIEDLYVNLEPETIILGDPTEGRQVQVRAQALGDGQLVAVILKVAPVAKSGSGESDSTLPAKLVSGTPDPDTFRPIDYQEEQRGESDTPEAAEQQRTSTSQPPTNKSADQQDGGPHSNLEPTKRLEKTPRATPEHRRNPERTLQGTRERTRDPEHVPQATPERTRDPERTPQATRRITREPERTPRATPERTRDPERTPQATRERTREPEHTPQATRERTRDAERTPQATRERTREPERTPQATRERTRDPERTPQVTRERAREPESTPQATRRRTRTP